MQGPYPSQLLYPCLDLQAALHSLPAPWPLHPGALWQPYVVCSYWRQGEAYRMSVCGWNSRKHVTDKPNNHTCVGETSITTLLLHSPCFSYLFWIWKELELALLGLLGEGTELRLNRIQLSTTTTWLALVLLGESSEPWQTILLVSLATVPLKLP